MTTPAVTPQQSDPYAEFGGSATGSPSTSAPVSQNPLAQPNNSDPYAEFGGSITSTPQPTQTQPHDLTVEEYSALPPEQQKAYDKHIREGRSVFDPATGFIKGVGQTVNTLSGLISRVAPSVVRPSDVSAVARIETPSNPMQQVGGVGEGIAEFVLGDEALKGLSLAERLGLGVKIAKLAESNPVIAKIIGHGLNAVRGGTVTAGQQLAHGASPSEALKTGAEAAALGTGGGAATEGISSAMPAIKNVIRGGQPKLQTAIRDAAGTAAAKAEALGSHPDILSRQVEVPAELEDAHPVKLVYDEDGNVTDLDGRHRVMQAIDEGKEKIPVQVTLRDGTTSTVQQDPKLVAEKFGVTKESLAATDENQSYRAGNLQPREPVTKPAAKSATAAIPTEGTKVPATPKTTGGIRTAVEEISNEVKAKSQKLYQQLDRESGGRWQRYEDQLKNLNDKMDEVNGIDDEAYDRLETKRNDIETSQAQMLEDLKEKGIDPKAADDAVAHYKQAMALRDVDKAVKGSTAGDTRVGLKETVDPKKFVTRVQKLYDSGRLEQALGKEGSEALLKEAYAAKTARSIRNWSIGILGSAGLLGHRVWSLLPAATAAIE
jgi:hypothetical protein